MAAFRWDATTTSGDALRRIARAQIDRGLDALDERQDQALVDDLDARLDDAYADATSSTFHRWRKRAKYHRHHLRLLEAAWPAVLKARRREVHELTDILGDDHDLAVLRADPVGGSDRCRIPRSSRVREQQRG